MKIKQLYDKQTGESFYPITKINAIEDEEGKGLVERLDSKQDILLSGINIATINGIDITKGGNIEITGGGGGSSISYNKPLPSISIKGTWEFYNSKDEVVKASSISPTPNSYSPTIEFGYKAKFSGTYKWSKNDDTTKVPQGISSDSNWKDLPLNNVDSKVYESGKLTSNTTIKAKIYAAKTGLIVEGQNVVPATGNDYKEASVGLYFKHRAFYGVSTDNNITELIINSLSNNYLTSTKSYTINSVTAKENEYFIYAFPSSLGKLNSVIQDGATPVLGAFSFKTINITNKAGKTINYNVYITNNKGSFTNVSLKFT